MKDVGAEGESKDEGDDMYSKLDDFIPRPVMLWGQSCRRKSWYVGFILYVSKFQKSSKEQLCGL